MEKMPQFIMDIITIMIFFIYGYYCPFDSANVFCFFYLRLTPSVKNDICGIK